MGKPSDPDTNDLLEQAGEGDPAAIKQLFSRHRQRLERMVTIRMDPRLANRLDPSDVVQDAMLVAVRRFDDYLEKRPLPFYPWLRRLAWERLVQLHRKHVLRQKRAVEREIFPLPDQSAIHLANRLIASDTSPSGRVVRRERRDRVQEALSDLSDQDCEVLLLLYLEQLSTADMAAVLGITPAAVRQRHARALQRLHQRIGEL